MPQTGGILLDTCYFLLYTLVTVVFLSLHVLCIILQGSGLGLVALWPDLCFAQGATEEFSRMSFCCGCRHDQS